MYTIQRPCSDFTYHIWGFILEIEEVYMNNKPLKEDASEVIKFISQLENKDLSAYHIRLISETDRTTYQLKRSLAVILHSMPFIRIRPCRFWVSMI